MESSGKSRAKDPRLVRFGSNVHRLRVAAGLSQMALADRADLDRSLIGFIERAEREIGITKVWSLAQALDVPPGDLFV